MVRRFSWCTLVALVVLLFVTTDGLREHSTQIDDHKATNRGTLRFNSKSLEEATTVSPSPLSRSKTKWDRSAQSETLSNFERTIQASVINSEPKFDTSEHSTVRTIRTTERGSVSTATDVTSEWRRTSGKRFEETKRVEPTINRRDGKRYFSESNKGTKLKNNEQKFETSKGISRRTSNGRANNSTVTERLDNKGPSVFLATTESSRSRTGRKIQTTYSMKDLKTQIPTSRRYNSKKFRDVETTTASFRRESRGRSTTEKIERSTRSGRSKVNNAENNSIARRGPDPLLSESESVRVDIPLTVDETGNPASDVTTGFDVASQRRSDAKESSRSSRTGFERSKSRGRSNDSEASGSSRSASPRGSSKFSDSTTTEANEQVVSSRRNTVSRDRSRGSEIKKNSVNESRSRSRGRNVENNMKPISGGASERNVKRKVAGERNSSDRRSRIPDVTPRATDSRRQDTQDMRGRSRSKSRSDVTTPITMDVTTTVAPDTTVFTDVTATDSEITSTTIRLATTPSPRATSRPLSTSASTLEASGRGRGRGRSGSHGRKQKEDFFNHGLGFRGRKPSPEGSANVTESRKTVSWKNDSQSHGNPGWTLRRRPAHFNSENISKTIVSSPRDQTNEVVPSNEQSTSTETITTIESSTFGTKRGLKKLQTTDESSTVVETTTKSYRRGNKTFGNGKVIAALEESDNYPPEFKARLTQLKNTNTKIPASKTTSRTPLEEQERNIYGRRSRNNSMAFEPDDLETAASANVLTDETLVVNPLTLINGTGLRRVKKSSAALFAERSRMKLELARRLVKPELNIEENDLDATTASSFSKRKPTGVPVVDETSKVAKYSKPAAAAPGRNRPSTSVESTQEEVSVKTLKLPSSRKAHDDSSKVTGRPYSLKKGRVIAERMVTSISIEERAIAEETTRPYALTTNPSMITSAEQGSATTIDSTRVRLASDRGGKKSKEEDSTPTKNMKVSLYSTQRVETTDLVTTIKPKKSYSYQSRNKLREQSATIDQSFTTSTPKKSYSSTQSKSQTSQEENITKKSKFATSATKPIFRPRYSKRTNEKSFEKKTTDEQATFTTKLPVATSRYSKKKSSVKSIDDKSATTEGLSAQTRKIEFRPRTATYRRHSEIPTTLTESSTKVDGVGIAITPRSTKYHATLKTSTVSPRSVAQGPQVNLKIANETAQETPGITGSSNGDSGNSNVFNPTRSTFLSGNSTLLEQLRSTVAPLLSSLGNKTPVFSGSYSNVNNVNSPPRVTPSGQPPRFSARYKGAELFVRKQNNIYQPTVPSITSSSTTPITPVENSGSAPPIDVSSPGEPRFLTLYQALESASIRNEQLQGNAIAQLQKQQAGSVSQVDFNATAVNDIGDNANNDTTSPTVATISPQTSDTTANTIQDSTQTPRLPEDPDNSIPAVTTGAPETPSTTEPVFTSTESSSSTEQASTNTESPSSTEQLFTSTESSTSTESFLRSTDATTMNVEGAEDVQTSMSADNNSTNQELVSSTTDAFTTISSTSEGSSTEFEGDTSSTTVSTATQSTTGNIDITSRIDLSQNTMETTTFSTTVTNTATTFENLETNTIPLSDTTATQTADISSTDALTTEADSSNMIDIETTTAIPTSTIRTRLIDLAQDILFRLQATMSTTTVLSQDSTTMLSPTTETSNVIRDSSSNRSLESLSQLRDETTINQGESGTTTPSSVTTEQSSLRTIEEVITQSADSIAVSSPTMVFTQEVNTQDEINAITTTTPATITSTTITQDFQTVSNTDSTTVGDSNDSSTSPLNVDVTTVSTITSTDDTLLTELMSIAKTLFSDEINDNQEEIAGQNSNVTSRLDNLMENEIYRPSLSNDELSTTQVAETSSFSLNTMSENVESSTIPVDPSQNEVDFTTTVSSENLTDTLTTTPQSNMPDDEVESVQTETTPVVLGPLAEIIESTTPSFKTEIEPRVTLSLSGSFDADTGLNTTTQTQTTTSTQSSETTTTFAMNFELTTDTLDLFSSNLITATNPHIVFEQVTESVTEPTGVTVPLTSLTTVTSRLMTDIGTTTQPEITTVAPETTPSSVNTITMTPSISFEQTTLASAVEFVERVNDVEVETNQTTESTTQLASLITESADNETPEPTPSSITTTAQQDFNSVDDTGVTTNQFSLTSTTIPVMETTTNAPSENVPQTTPNLENKSPTIVARFQDTTSATAQATAGSGIGQTTEITTPTIPDTSIVSSTSSEFPTSSYPDVPLITTTSSSVETTTTTITTETATSTSTGRVPDGGTSTPQTTRMDVVTVTPVTETTTVNIEENLVSTEVGTSTTTASSESTTTMSGGTTNDSTNTISASTEATTVSMQATPGTTVRTATSLPPRPASQSSTTPYLGRFGGSRLTPAPRFSLSSTTRAPLRDYLVYGIYPNKTIVRKRPEDNLIDARNVDSPYVIFGIFPDGRLVRKYPNGTIIPDPPRNPVEVVFSLSTSTTTNRPPPRPYYNQANQGTYNQYRGPVYNSNDRPVAEPMRNVQSPSIVDLGLTGNAIVGPNGGGPDNTGPLGTPASVPSTNEMSNALLNTQMRTASVTPIVSTGRPPTDSQGGRIVQDRERDEATRTKEAGGQRSSVYIGQDKFVNYWTDGASTSNPRVLSVNINSVATAANEGSSPSVPSFENLLNNQPGGRVTAPPGFPWRDPLDQIFGITTSSPIITASVSSNRLDDLSEPNGPALARPINPFVEVFTPFSNTIGVPRGNIGSIPPPPPPTTPVAFTTTPTTPAPTTTTTTTSTTMAPTTTTTTTTVAPTTTTMMTPITTTTTMAPTTTTTMMTPTTTTTTMAPTTTTTTMAPTTTTIRAPTVTITTTTSTTMTPTTVAAMTPTTTTMAAPIITSEPPTIVQRVMIASQAGATSETTTSSQINSLNLPKNLLNTRQQNAFGTTFDDLAFLNSLLQSNSRSTSQKTLTQVEQLLANKILELALKNPGPTRSPKAISIENASPNSIYKSATTSRSEPIIIDLSPASTVSTSTRKSVETRQPTSQRPVISSLTPVQVTWKPVTTTSTRRSVEISTASPSTTAKTTLISTTKAPVTVKAKLATTPRPRTTTQAPLGFGGLLWQALLGGGLFGSSTTPKPVKAKLVPKTTQKSVNIMPKPIQTTQKLETTTISSSATLKTVDISKIQVNSPYSIVQEKSVTTPFTISTTDKPLINNPNPRLPGVVTSTYSPEEDAKFIVELLRAVEQDNKTGSKKVSGLTQDDQSFLRAILSGRALTTTTPSPTVEVSNAALLAALLKAQGIEPPTPANNIREQLQLASLGQSVTSAPTASPASESSTITTRPASTAASRPTDTTKKTVTPRPTSGPRIRTTTWSPSSTYPPPLFSSFSNYGTPGQSTGDNSGNSALFGATRAFSQFLGAAISGAAQQLQSLVRNGTRIVSEVVG
ncbi:mucin-2-like isoform X5 [Bombus flavifrons]|uniref:mucin-2-like isoform X5 n=1 Tax=Bombus flavifrons TaxID=103934 RepID=UPI003703B080